MAAAGDPSVAPEGWLRAIDRVSAASLTVVLSCPAVAAPPAVTSQVGNAPSASVVAWIAPGGFALPSGESAAGVKNG